jgi:hypothetical protein
MPRKRLSGLTRGILHVFLLLFADLLSHLRISPYLSLFSIPFPAFP